MNYTNQSKFEFNPRIAEKFPLRWDEIFGRSAPVGIEIGCGNGEFLVSWAKTIPDWNFIGIEHSFASVKRILSRLRRAELENIHVIRDDALFALRELFLDESVRLIVMNFPDPWPKEKHKTRRIIRHKFAECVAAVLEMNGSFEMVTDQEWYARQALEIFKESRAFASSDVELDPERELKTKYEQKWRRQYRAIFRFQAKKIKNVTIKRSLENDKMPHAKLSKEIHAQDVFNLEGWEKKSEETLFKIKEIFISRDGKAFVLRTITKDGEYKQNFFLIIAPHGEGAILKIDSVFQPYRTPAVKMAILEVAKAIEQF
jgi:tRNA (guanine-N7-)-methyltransferase